MGVGPPFTIANPCMQVMQVASAVLGKYAEKSLASDDPNDEKVEVMSTQSSMPSADSIQV